jgi:hypothetical protein
MWQLTKQIYLLLTRKNSVKILCTARWRNALWKWKFKCTTKKWKLKGINILINILPGSVAWDILLKYDHQKQPWLLLLHTFAHFHCCSRKYNNGIVRKQDKCYSYCIFFFTILLLNCCRVLFMSLWICQDRYCIHETPCGPLTLPTHFMSLILNLKHMCTTGAHVETHMDLKVMELRIS